MTLTSSFKKPVALIAGIIGGMFVTNAAQAADEIKIGYLAATSGPFVSLAKTNTIAAKMALDEINAAGGINGKKLKIVEFDTGGRPGQAVVGLRRLAKDDDVLAIVGPFSSSEAKVVFPQADRVGVVSMSMASSAPGLSAKYPFGFRNTTNEGIMISSVLKTLKSQNFDTGSATIAHATDDAVSVAIGTKIFPAILPKSNIDVKGTVTFKHAAFDLSVQTTQMVNEPADLVAVGAPPEAAIKLVKEMRRQGHAGRVIAGSTIFDVELPTRMGSEGVGTVLPTSFYWERNEEAREFARKFAIEAKAAGSERVAASQFDASTYSIVKMFAMAIKNAGATGDKANLGKERAAVRDQLAAIRNMDTIEGSISIGDDGDALKPVYVMEIIKDGWKHIDTHNR